MKGDTKRIERLLRNAPRPAVPGHLLRKLKEEAHPIPLGSATMTLRSPDNRANHSVFLPALLRLFKSNRFNLGGLGVAWTIILLCRISLLHADGPTTMAKLNRPSLQMLAALVGENRRLLFTMYRSNRAEPEGAKSNTPGPRTEVQLKSNAG
jgi:hypothetical protein